MALPATDNFNRASLGTNWTTVYGLNALQIYSSTVCGCSSGDSSSYWNVDSFGGNQYSQCILNTASPSYNGPTVRAAANQEYGAEVVSNLIYGIYKFNGAFTYLGSGVSVTTAANDTWKLEAVGTTITLYQNGVSRKSVTDATFNSGSAGLHGYSDSTGYMDNWEGGNVSAGGANWLKEGFWWQSPYPNGGV